MVVFGMCLDGVQGWERESKGEGKQRKLGKGGSNYVVYSTRLRLIPPPRGHLYMRRSLPAAACISPAPCACNNGSVVCGCRHRAFAAFPGEFLSPAPSAGAAVGRNHQFPQ
jgi:hypothetical protein